MAEYRQLLAACFDVHNITVAAEAGDGASGLEAVVEHDPDLVITDLQMPGTDGLWLARQLRECRPGLPILMATNSRDPRLPARAAEAGVTSFVVKRRGPAAVAAAARDLC